MIQADMDITVEAGAFENDAHSGKRARVFKVINNAIAIIQIEGVEGLRGCTIDTVQPRMTAHNMENRHRFGIAQPLTQEAYTAWCNRWSQEEKAT